MLLYNLTMMTGKEAMSSGKVVIGVFDINKRAWYLFAATLPISVIMAALAWLFVGEYAIIAAPATSALILWMFHFRSTKGLRLRHYRTFMDHRRAAVGVPMLANRPIDVAEQLSYRTMQSTAAYGASDRTRERSESSAEADAPPGAVSSMIDGVFR
ncbi:hypothetical protein [Aeromicrobium sp. CTD01-1L150]|uniref:hypothetical protein n=1 Tax=Aeromicrobium sp. CTD01-1L150 TaxID=3341830 RepID=UPI0035BF3766